MILVPDEFTGQLLYPNYYYQLETNAIRNNKFAFSIGLVCIVLQVPVFYLKQQYK